MMATATAPARIACFSVPALRSAHRARARSAGSVAPPWWRRSVSASSAAAALAAVLLGGSAMIEVARAWTSAPHPGGAIGEVVGGALVALLVVASLGLAWRMRALSGVALAASLGLFAHGATLLLVGDAVGALFVVLAPAAGLLGAVAFARGREEDYVRRAR